MSTVIGTFDTERQAEKAVKHMRDNGFGDNEISIVARDRRDIQGRGDTDTEAGDEEMGMGSVATGTAWGGALGGIAGLLAGAGALAIPGVGPIIAAGPLAAALSGVVAGGVVGGLVDLGIPQDRSNFYQEEVKKGKILAVIDTDDKIEDAESVLNEFGANNVETY
ncbi:MAG: hypothetical protein PHV61_10860 [Limnochordia bacterium]|nr:general stress protein [Limnochordia bacterium]MDD2630642.1 hypothetical protein [Limnochordia bacterium]